MSAKVTISLPTAPVKVYSVKGMKVADSTDTLLSSIYILRKLKTIREIIVE